MDKVDRETAFANLIALWGEICDLTTTSLTDWRIPGDIKMRPVGQNEKRLKQGNLYVLYNVRENTASVELPEHYSEHPFRFCTQVPDRSSIGVSMLHFMVHLGYLCPAYFGFFHSLWNAIKNAAKKAGRFCHRMRGYIWRHILNFVCIANMNGGPYRSNQWAQLKQSAGKRFHEMFNWASPEFQAIAAPFAKAAGIDISTQSGMESLFARMGCLKSCSEIGQRVKLMRWLSIEEQWHYHKSEIWGFEEC